MATLIKTPVSTLFHKISLEDKKWIDPLYQYQKFRSCEYSFANLFLWGEQYGASIAKIGEFLVTRVTQQNVTYSYPVGGGGPEEIKAVIELLIEEAKRTGVPLVLHGLVESAPAQLEALFPGRFAFTTNRDSSDYIYSSESLITLAGKKLSAKRNHINNFLRNNPDWTFEPLDENNLSECQELVIKWCLMNGCSEDPSKQNEFKAVALALRYFNELELSGGLIRTGGEVIAFSIGEPLTDDTFVVHIEKTFSDIQGAYPIINREFARHFASGYRYINREEDLGVPGLRKAKLSYHPEIILDKYAATLKD